ncbi:HNH/ENDO VII superfamily nuclease [Breznakia blatticola]|uniref:HNH/ENDO VII superfamily nuclease n=1 Tax=Breznakia blatticola TaxID=1754012 RepID=A0A4V3G6Q3_9FIRM|nr:HNH endonuclease [Breznakia blatticola]TDW16244.1 HNH/ENDO VII superfamily nuclease [Breznakia blatticola]
MTKTKIVCTRWEDNEVKNNAMLSNLISLDLDGPVNRINAEFARLPHIAKISYSNLNEKKNTAMYGLSTISGYVTKIIDYIDEYIDDPFYKKLNGPTGVLERLEKIRLDDSKYQVKNTAGIETEKTVYITDPYTHQTKAEVVKEVKNKISIEDMLKTSGVKGSSSIPTFKDLYKEQFDQQSKANPDLKYSEYVDQLIHRADISHSVDAGWLNVVSDVLDIVGIVSIVGIFTGKDFITGEIYTKAERDAALINGIISIGSLAFAGVGLVGSGLKATAVGLGKAVALDMAAGAAGMGAGAVAGALGAPDELRALITIGTAMGAGYGLGKITNKNINKASKGSGANLDNINGFAKGNKNFDDVVDDYARIYADKVKSNKSWEWMDIEGAENLTPKQMKEIRELAKTNGYIPNIQLKPGTNYPDFESSDVIYKVNGNPVIEQLPEDLWLKGDKAQFDYLDSQLPGGVRPKGYTWHHSEISGRMELVEYGIHNSTWHKGGRAPGGWADAKR